MGSSGDPDAPRVIDRSTSAWLIPLGIALAYLALFLVQLSQNLRAIGWVSDYSSGFLMAETIAQSGTGGNTVIASYGEFVPLWFGLLTASLPLHRELWSIAPTLAFIASGLAVGWSVARLSTRRVGLLAALLVIVASPRALSFFMAAMAHNTVYPATALTGLYLVWLANIQERRPWVSILVCALAGIALGTCLASDLLIAPTVLLPLALTAGLAGLRRSRRSRLLALSALTSAGLAIPVALLTTSIMKGAGYVTLTSPTETAQLSDLPQHAELLLKGLKALFNGYLGSSGAGGTLHGTLGLACEIAMSAALLALIALALRTLLRFMLGGLRGPTSETPSELAFSLHIIYWVGSAVTVCSAFAIFAETRGTVPHESYYASVILSVAAVVPLLLLRGSLARWLILAGSAVFFTGSLVGLTSGYAGAVTPIASSEPEVLRIARINHVTAGYAGYWEASSFTWSTKGQVSIRPVMECETTAGVAACPMYLMRVPSWYAPQNRKSFVLVDSTEAFLSRLPAGLGHPLAHYSFGTMQMYIYPYDVASRLA